MVDDLVSLTVMVGAIFFCSRKYEIVHDQSQAPNLRLVFNGIEDLVDGELQRSEVSHQLIGLERVWRDVMLLIFTHQLQSEEELQSRYNDIHNSDMQL